MGSASFNTVSFFDMLFKIILWHSYFTVRTGYKLVKAMNFFDVFLKIAL